MEVNEIKIVKRKFDATDLIIEMTEAMANQFDDDVRCSIGPKVTKSKDEMSNAIKTIDEIRKVEVPIKTFLFFFLLFMSFIFGLAYIMIGVMRLFIWIAVGLVVYLVCSGIFAFSYITYVSFAQEEIDDAKTMAELYNKIKKERGNQLNYIRMDLKLKALDKSRDETEYNNAFLHTMNNWRLQTLDFYKILAYCPSEAIREQMLDELFERMQEICFNNPVFMKRLHDQMMDNSQRASYVDHFITEVFTVWLPVHFFSKRALALQNTSACKHNIEKLVNTAATTVTNFSVREMLA